MKMWTTLAAMAALSLSALATVSAQAAENAAAAPDATQQDPGKLVQGVAEAMLKDLDANRAAYKQDPSKVEALVEKHLLPHFDTAYAAQLVLGKHWRTASPEQRQRFIDAFYKSLLHNYGSALADFTGERLKVLPANVDPGSDRATVRTLVKRDNGQQVPVNYSLRKVNGEWKAWDVVIEGISYVKSFREDFGAEIDQRGLDAVIERMEKGGKPVAGKAASKSN
jgi:phospholipid transport system substrate-binding protein